MPVYRDAAALAAAEQQLGSYPPLVFAGEARNLKDELAEVVSGKSFMLQGGACAESLAVFRPNNISDTFRVILQSSEEHTSAVQSLMRISYAVFRLRTKTTSINS